VRQLRINRNKRWGLWGWLLAILIVGGSAAVYQAQVFAAQRLPAYLSTRLSTVLGRPVTVGTVSLWPPGAFSVHNVRVLAAADETEPPLVAERARVYLNWWELVFHRNLKIQALHLDRAQVRGKLPISEAASKQTDAAATLRSLAKLGLRQVGLHDSKIDLTTIQPAGGAEPVAIRGVDLVANLRGDAIRFRAGANQWTGGGLVATDLQLRGVGDAQGVRITRSGATFRGGRLNAQGTYVARGGGVAMQVQVKELPLQTLAPQLGIPKDWALSGNVSGNVEVNAASGELERIDGIVQVARGFVQRSQAVLPWTHAQAQVKWRRNEVDLRGIQIQGNGLQLTGNARVGGTADQPITERPYSATGRIVASKAEAVASLTQLLAFSNPIPGNWSVQGANVDFQANGTVGALAESAAKGHFQAKGFSMKPSPNGNPLLVQTVQGDVVRTGNQLQVRNLVATAEGLTAKGDLTVNPTQGEKAGHFSSRGTVSLSSLVTFRQQLPQATFWQWIDPATAGSKGVLTYQASGPTADPKQLTGTGSFQFHGFDASVPSGKGAERWRMPIRELTGQLRMNDQRLALSNVRLNSELFTGSADLLLTNLSQSANVSGSAHLVSERWQQLPPLQGRLPKSLAGGVLSVDTRLPAEPATGKKAMTGKVVLNGATYRVDFHGKSRVVPLESASASFRMDGDRVLVPDYRIVAPHFRTSGSGTATPAAKGSARWLLHGSGTLAASDAGVLAHWLTDQTPVKGGKLDAKYTVDAPSDAPAKLTLSGTARLTDALPVLPQGSLPFDPEEARIKSLTGAFTYEDGATRFEDVVWQAPRFRATAGGSLVNGRLDSRFKLSTAAWHEIAGELAKALPVSGGTLTVDGEIKGALANLKRAPVTGTLTLANARLASDKNASSPIDGGDLDVKVNLDGTLDQLVTANLTGTFGLRNVGLAPLRAGAKAVHITQASGAFRRVGTRVTLSDLVATAPGARLTGKGELEGIGTGKASHHFSFAAEGPSLAGLLPAVMPIPGSAEGGQFNGTLELSGTASQRLAKMDGRAEVHNLRWTPPGQTMPLKIESASTHMTRRGEVATLDQTELKMDGGNASLTGSIKGLGTPSGAQHTFQVKWTLEDASGWAGRLLPIPGGFSGGTFTGEATVAGNRTDPARTASGRFNLQDTGFMPPQKILGGPVRPITVYSAGSPFTRTNHLTTLTALTMKTSVGTATGTVTSDDHGIAKLQARANVEKLEALVDLWPGFKDKLRGGRGEMTLALQGPLRKPRQLAGDVFIAGRDGALTVENVDELYAVQPFDELSMDMNLHPDGSVRLSSVKMRGPKANLDGKGVIQANGKLHVEGQGWFTEAYTKKLVKPKFLWPIAKLVGYKRIKSRYELDGSLQEARLDLGITDSLLWKVAIKKRVPEPLRKIALGDAPVWSSEQPPSKSRVAKK